MAATLWKIGAQTFDLSQRGLIMGVLNVTPDSFSDGGDFFDEETARAHALRMLEAGADIIDVGGESTRPGAAPVAAAEEARRVIPAIESLSKIGAILSIDTTKAEVAQRALAAGARIINDVSGGRHDPAMFELAAREDAAFIIMHRQGTPRTMQTAPHYADVVAEVADFFRQQHARALASGLDPMRIAFDPGIGFGKTLDHNLELLANLDRLRVADRPLVVGVSRKSFLAKLVRSEDAKDRLAPTVAFTALLRARGADVLRVHDVKENVAAIRVADAMLARA